MVTNMVFYMKYVIIILTFINLVNCSYAKCIVVNTTPTNNTLHSTTKTNKKTDCLAVKNRFNEYLQNVKNLEKTMKFNDNYYNNI